MSLAYWTQWDKAEIMSMYGIDQDECNDDNQSDRKLDECDYYIDMDSLGLSYRDFI